MKPRKKAPRSGRFERPSPGHAQSQPLGDEIPPSIAMGADGLFYLSAEHDELSLCGIPKERGCFVGVALEEHASFAGAVAEFMRRTEPRVLGLNGRVYVECEFVHMGTGATVRSFYGYAATEEEAERIHYQLALIGMDVLSQLEDRPKKAKG